MVFIIGSGLGEFGRVWEGRGGEGRGGAEDLREMRRSENRKYLHDRVLILKANCIKQHTALCPHWIP